MMQNPKPFYILVLFLVSSFGMWAQSDLELGLQYYRNSEYEKALEYLEGSPRKLYHPQAYEPLFNSYLALEEYDEAEDVVKHYIRKSRLNQMDLYTDLLYINKLKGDEKGAEKAIGEIEEQVRNNPGLAYSAGNALQKRGYPKVSLKIYELAEAVNPRLNFDYQKALLYGELADIKNMYRMYISMVERSPNFLANVKSLLAQGLAQENSVENTDYLKELLVSRIQEGAPQTINDLLIFVYIQEENYRGAFTQLKALDKRNEGNRSELFNLGVITLNNKEYALAEKIFDYVLDAGRDNPFYEEALIQILLAKKGTLESKGDVEIQEWNALQKEYLKVRKELRGLPEIGQLNINLAHLIAFKSDDLDSAVSILKNTISTGYISREDQALAKIELGDVLLYKGDRWEAIIYYGQAEKAFENSPIGQEAKFKRAKAAYYVGNFEWAMGIFDALKASTSKLIANDAMKYSLLINDNIALDTNMEAMQMFAKADLLNYQDKKDSALVLLAALRSGFPGHSIQDEVLLLKADILIQKKRYQEATEDLIAIVDIYADDILADDAMFRLARLYEERLNKPEDAKEYYRRLFTEHPDSFFTSEARKRFRRLRGDILN